MLTTIHCGSFKPQTAQFDEHSSIDHIHEHVRHLCGSRLPQLYHLRFYNEAMRTLCTLNESELDGSFNPFWLAAQDMSRVIGSVQLFVVDVAKEIDGNHTSYGISYHERSSPHSSEMSQTTASETTCQEDLPVLASQFNNNTFYEEQSRAILNKPIDTDINAYISPASVAENTGGHAESSEAHDRETHPTFGNRCSRGHELQTADLSDALLPGQLPVHNSSTNNNWSAPVTMGVSTPLQNNPRERTLITNPSAHSTQPEEPSNDHSNRLYFTRDVKPVQKDIHSSDYFNQRVVEQTNGGITRVQGIKANPTDRNSVWPKVHIPGCFLGVRSMRLLVYVVSEQLANGSRLWFAHRDKGFLPQNFTRGTPSINPLELDYHDLVSTPQGDLILDLCMVTSWNKLKEKKKIYQLSEESTIRLHPADHDSLSPRLLCVLRRDTGPCWDTLCLSDFIRKPTSSKRNSNNVTVPVSTATNKRPRGECPDIRDERQ